MIDLKLLDTPYLQQLVADPAAALAAHGNRDAIAGIVAEIAPATLGLYEMTGATAPWLSYLAIRTGDNAILGICSFKSAPVDGLTEIAYFTFPGYEGQGVATAMARELVQIAFASSEVAALLAHTLPEENASTAVLRRCGFTPVDVVEDPEDGTVWRWALAKDA